MENENMEKAVKEVFQKTIEMNGTITGEHGVGITKSPFLEMEISKPTLELMKRIKTAFDPNGILNPGKIFPYWILLSPVNGYYFTVNWTVFICNVLLFSFWIFALTVWVPLSSGQR